jgi:hypothetical protein
MRVLGNEDMPENFDFGGMSGGPVVAIVQTPILRSWIPAGVIFQGPNPSDDPEADQSVFQACHFLHEHLMGSSKVFLVPNHKCLPAL